MVIRAATYKKLTNSLFSTTFLVAVGVVSLSSVIECPANQVSNEHSEESSMTRQREMFLRQQQQQHQQQQQYLYCLYFADLYFFYLCYSLALLLLPGFFYFFYFYFIFFFNYLLFIIPLFTIQNFTDLQYFAKFHNFFNGRPLIG